MTQEESVCSEVIFLIGAGASIPIGIPGMQGIYRAFLNKSKSSITSEEKRTCRFLTKNLGVPEDLEELLLSANAIAEFNLSSLGKLVEKCVSVRQSSKQVIIYRSRLKDRILDIATLKRRILDFLSDTCFKFDRTRAIEIFNGFVKGVSHRGYTVFTTNYDFALEYVATEQGITIHDNFVENGQRNLWNESIQFPVGGALTLVKLHGSVTWYEDEEGTIEKIYHNPSVA